MSQDWRSDVLKFWFGLEPAQWWNGDAEFDHRVRQQFLKLWMQKRQLPVDAFLTDPLTAVAAVILFDQFPRNMFRGHAEQFATDHIALAIARAAIDKGFDQKLAPDECLFLYMPLQHSENLADQDRAILLFTEIGNTEQIEHAKRHREVIARFGRFPHRNAILGRDPRADELAAGDVNPF